VRCLSSPMCAHGCDFAATGSHGACHCLKGGNVRITPVILAHHLARGYLELYLNDAPYIRRALWMY